MSAKGFLIEGMNLCLSWHELITVSIHVTFTRNLYMSAEETRKTVPPVVSLLLIVNREL